LKTLAENSSGSLAKLQLATTNPQRRISRPQQPTQWTPSRRHRRHRAKSARTPSGSGA